VYGRIAISCVTLSGIPESDKSSGESDSFRGKIGIAEMTKTDTDPLLCHWKPLHHVNNGRKSTYKELRKPFPSFGKGFLFE